MNETYCTTREVAAAFGVTPSTVRRWVAEGLMTRWWTREPGAKAYRFDRSILRAARKSTLKHAR